MPLRRLLGLMSRDDLGTYNVKTGRPSARLLSSLTLFFGVVCMGGILAGCDDMHLPVRVEQIPPVSSETAARSLPDPLLEPAPTPVHEGTVKEGETLSHILSSYDLTDSTIRSVLRALSSKAEVGKLRPGNTYRLELDDSGQLTSFQFAFSREKRFRVDLIGEEFRASEERVSVETRPMLVTGTVKTTLVDALLEQGQSYAFTMALIEAFQWDINFYTDVQEGDTFQAVVEQVYVDGSPERVEKVLVARYQGRTVGKKEAFLFRSPHGSPDSKGEREHDYFDAKGQYLQRSFLTTPLSVLRITSRFGQRFHPILRISRPHRGIDYGASTGTPVWSVADGQVLFAGRRRDGYGKQVMISHAGGYVSRYAHLSRINLKTGQRVKQKMRVGAVGATGLASGPHLHFEMLSNGQQINPARLKMLPTVVRTVKDMKAFQVERDRLLGLLDHHLAASVEPVAAVPPDQSKD